MRKVQSMTSESKEPARHPAPQHLPFLTLVLLLLMALYALHGPVRAWLSGRYRAVATVDRAMGIILDEYAEPVAPRALVHGAVGGMVDALGDPHSAFLKPLDNRRLQEAESGKYAGLGFNFDLVKGQVVIQQVFHGSPAFRAGLRPGDVILAATEHDRSGFKAPQKHDLTAIKSVHQIALILRGEKGTTVTLRILRDGEGIDVTVTREVIPRPVVEHRLLAEGIGYLRIRRDFPDGACRKVEAALHSLREQQVRGIVLDLRLNQGGFLDEAVRVADLFIPGGVIVSTRTRRERESRVFRAEPGGPAEDLPIVVLVGAGTASAAEALAGALQDHGRARLVGVPTYGKSFVNKRFELPDGSGLLITTGRYFLPKGRQIEGKGLKPDVKVEPPSREELDKLPPGAKRPDPQLDAAVDLLRQQLAATTD